MDKDPSLLTVAELEVLSTKEIEEIRLKKMPLEGKYTLELFQRAFNSGSEDSADAFAAIFRVFSEWSRRQISTALSKLAIDIDEATAEGIFQDAWLSFRKIDLHLESPNMYLRYLHRSMANSIVYHIRVNIHKHNNDADLPIPHDYSVSFTMPNPTDIEREILLREFNSRIQELVKDPIELQVLHLKLLSGYSNREVAKRINDERGGVSSTKKVEALTGRIRKRLRSDPVIQDIVKRIQALNIGDTKEGAYGSLLLAAEEDNATPQISQPSMEKKSVLLKIESDLSSFTDAEQSKLIQALAEATGQPTEHFKIVGIKEGSVLVTLEMPEDAALKLLSLYLQKDPLLASLKISKVELQQSEDKPTPALQSIVLSPVHIAKAISSLIPNNPVLSNQVAELIARSLSDGKASNHCDLPKEEVVRAFQELAGKNVNVDNKVLSFGDQSQLGDVTVRDVVGGNAIHVNINIFNA